MLTREVCDECGKESAVGFAVPDDVWRLSVPLAHARGVLCIGCFVAMADRRGVRWDRDIDFFPVSRVTHEEAVA